MRHTSGFIVLIALSLAASDAAENTCSLSGVAVAKSGEPVPNVYVAAMAFRGLRRPGSYQATTGVDGRFDFKEVPCGKLMVSANTSDYAGQVMQQVDVSKQPSLRLVIPNVDPLAVRLGSKRNEPTLNVGPVVAAGPEDPEITKLRREYFLQLDPSRIEKFDRAPLPDQMRMYQAGYAAVLMRMTEVDQGQSLKEYQAQARKDYQAHAPKGLGIRGFGRQQQEQPATRTTYQDMSARVKLNSAAAIIKNMLSAEDSAAFLRASEVERGAYFFRAVSAMPTPQALCSRFALYVIDTDTLSPGSAMGSQTAQLLDETGQTKWGELDPKGRCQLLARGKERLLRIALSIVRDGSEDNVAAIVKQFGVPGQSPRHAILENFGDEAGNRYDALTSTEQRLQLYKAALLMQLCWSAAYFTL